MEAKGTLSEDTIASFLKQIAGAMVALNAKGIVHRDLKPQNILLCHAPHTSNPHPSEIQLKIADFGFARFLQDGVMAATLCGSPMYMAPEVIMSLQYDAKADLWSVGTIVYQCLTGKAPFQAQTPQQLKQFYEKNATLQPNIPPGTSKELKHLLLTLLKRNAKERIDFDDFFKHPFLNPKARSSSPVPVPRTRLHGSVSDSPTVKAVSTSPLSGHVAVSPPMPCRLPQRSGHQLMDIGGSPQEGFMKGHPRCLTPPEDFVLVPENIPSDHSVSSAGSGGRYPSSADLTAIFSDNSPDSPKLNPKLVRNSPRGGTVPMRKKAALTSSPRQTSPSRPSSLPVHCPSTSPSQPIPVPSQVRAYEQIQRSVGGSPSSPPSARVPSSPKGVPIPRKASTGSIASVGSISPPSVQFTIGTPPGAPWRKMSLGSTPPMNRHTPPPGGTSPLRRASGPAVTTTRMSVPNVAGTSPALPTIVGSPTKFNGALRFTVGTPVQEEPLFAPFGGRMAVPVESDDRSMTEPGAVISRSSSATRLSDQLLKAAFGIRTPSGGAADLPAGLSHSPTTGVVVPYSSAALPTGTFPHAGSSSSLKESATTQVTFAHARTRTLSCGLEESASDSMRYMQSLPTMEGPVTFVAPELAEEVLMDKSHNETVSKLSFVLALVECIIDLAQSRSSPLSESVTEKVLSSSPGGGTATMDHISFMSEGDRCIEQLVLYVRALQLLSSSIQLAKEEVSAGRLHPSNNVRALVTEMNAFYHQCLCVCKFLHNKSSAVRGADVTSVTATVTADRLIYSHAIEMCQTAAADELFGNPRECFHRYRNAQILLHSLAQQARDDHDRQLLNKYRESVEKRLYTLYNQGYVNIQDNS
ncbi:hypothetical protein NP493_383g02026 [Ridgeia piscesae]|uniref:non-specific serine/threonine protein kinase n=1 Tax=Ridgeia piscesae TaxID=27915 RepID=A0AAD9L2C4_RIDPI|nr:hypothetical protein NP493_383g02026 [Ridgeia piscesae]